MHEFKTSEPAESAVRSIGLVVPQRRKYSPLMAMMAYDGDAAIGHMMTFYKDGVCMVDDLRPRRHESGLEVTAADVEAIKKAEAKRERKALAKAKRHNARMSDAPQQPSDPPSAFEAHSSPSVGSGNPGLEPRSCPDEAGSGRSGGTSKTNNIL